MFLNANLQEMIDDFEIGMFEAYEIVCLDRDTRIKIADGICDAVDEMDTSRRIVRISLKEYDDFSKVLRRILFLSLSDAKFDQDDAELNEERIDSLEEEQDLYDLVSEVFKHNYPYKNIHVMILLEDFELAGGKWNSDQFGNLRTLYTDTNFIFLAVIADRTVQEVTELPIGSSALYNIFPPHTIEIGKEDEL